MSKMLNTSNTCTTTPSVMSARTGSACAIPVATQDRYETRIATLATTRAPLVSPSVARSHCAQYSPLSRTRVRRAVQHTRAQR